jgi:integrase
MRLSELVRLKVPDIALPHGITQDEEQTGFAHVTRSNGRTERIPLNHKASQALVAYLTERPPSPYLSLFLNRFDAPLSKRRVR